MSMIWCIENDTIRLQGFEFDGQGGFLSMQPWQSIVFVSTELDITEACSTALVHFRIIRKQLKES